MGLRFDLDEMPRLETERLVLRPLVRPEDEAGLMEIFRDPAVARHTDTGPFDSPAEAAALADWIEQIFREGRGMRWIVAERSKPTGVVGTCGYHYVRAHNNCAEIGYDLLPHLCGRGLMVEALRPVLTFGFDRLELNKVDAGVTVANTASARVLEKLGFTEEGLIRAGGHWRGEYHDLRVFGLLRSEWQGGDG